MVSINYSAREVCCKIVYYGPGLSGKTTNLQYVHTKIPSNTRGKLISLATEADRTLYVDFLPINIGTINGFQAKFQLYTVPGQVYYNATRKLVLRGVDGIVLVADSQPDKMDENIESLANLVENLSEYGYNIDDVPVVIQYNKQDLPGVLSVEELQARLNTRGWEYFAASATVGNGVFDTLKLIIKLVLEKAKSASGTKIANAPQAEPAPVSSAQPVGAEQPVVAGPADAVAVAEPARPEAAEESAGSSVYRPYPGSEGVNEPEPIPVAKELQDDDSATDESSPAETPEVSKPAESEQLKAPVQTNSTPRMAPSIRRREETKKRGFFKRLFGLR
jgi:signal recognition particle receptor subunit beta